MGLSSLKADVTKAAFRTKSAAVAAISFDFCHPECLIKSSSKTSDAEKDGYLCVCDGLVLSEGV